MVHQFRRPQFATPEITVDEIPGNYTESTTQFLDVREIDEWNDANIPGTIHIPLGELMTRFIELDITLPVVTICHLGQRSLAAGDFLLKSGFTDVKSLQGGIVAWANKGRPLN